MASLSRRMVTNAFLLRHSHSKVCTAINPFGKKETVGWRGKIDVTGDYLAGTKPLIYKAKGRGVALALI